MIPGGDEAFDSGIGSISVLVCWVEVVRRKLVDGPRCRDIMGRGGFTFVFLSAIVPDTVWDFTSGGMRK